MTFPKRIVWNYYIVLKTLFSLRRIDEKGNSLEITLHKHTYDSFEEYSVILNKILTALHRFQ